MLLSGSHYILHVNGERLIVTCGDYNVLDCPWQHTETLIVSITQPFVVENVMKFGVYLGRRTVFLFLCVRIIFAETHHICLSLIMLKCDRRC